MLLGLVTYSVGKEHVTRPKSICVGGQLLLCNYDNLFFFLVLWRWLWLFFFVLGRAKCWEKIWQSTWLYQRWSWNRNYAWTGCATWDLSLHCYKTSEGKFCFYLIDKCMNPYWYFINRWKSCGCSLSLTGPFLESSSKLLAVYAWKLIANLKCANRDLFIFINLIELLNNSNDSPFTF